MLAHSDRGSKFYADLHVDLSSSSCMSRFSSPKEDVEIPLLLFDTPGRIVVEVGFSQQGLVNTWTDV